MTTSGRNPLTLIVLCMAIMVAGLTLALYLQIKDSSNAAEERAANHQAIQVLGSLTCERATRLDNDEDADLYGELNKKGFVSISPECQRFVGLLQEDLVYDNEKVILR